MLERVVPLMDHPSEAFVTSLETALISVVADGGMVIIQSALACLAATSTRLRRRPTAIIKRFMHLLSIHFLCL